MSYSIHKINDCSLNKVKLFCRYLNENRRLSSIEDDVFEGTALLNL